MKMKSLLFLLLVVSSVFVLPLTDLTAQTQPVCDDLFSIAKKLSNIQHDLFAISQTYGDNASHSVQQLASMFLASQIISQAWLMCDYEAQLCLNSFLSTSSSNTNAVIEVFKNRRIFLETAKQRMEERLQALQGLYSIITNRNALNEIDRARDAIRSALEAFDRADIVFQEIIVKNAKTKAKEDKGK
jgi:hypothetical protein